MDAVFALFSAATSGWSTVATVTVNILLVILGINALIIVHEFGHFAVARLCGVRCEKFYIWFDFWGLKFFKFKWGNTEYGLGMFPLGGYVKMLGQEDNPGELRAEMERAKLANNQTPQTQPETITDNIPSVPESGNSEHSEPADLEKLNEAVFAPDSYLAKNVPQRLAIIVAGVVMNFLFAIVCATAAYMVGIEETAPAIGSVVTGSPAWEAGLQTGDKIIAINDSPARVWMDISMAIVGNPNGVKLTIERQSVDNNNAEPQQPNRIEKTIVPRKRKNDLAPTIGVESLPSLDLASDPASDQTPVVKAWEKYYSEETLQLLKQPKLQIKSVQYGGNNQKDWNKEVNNYTEYMDKKLESLSQRNWNENVKNYAEYLDKQLRNFDQPFLCGLTNKETGKDFDVKIPAIPMKEIGIRFKMGAIAAVLPDSDAAAKGIEAGDSILSVDGVTDFDPLKLPQIILRKVNEDKKSVQLVIRKKDGQEQTIDAGLQPVRILPELGALSMKDPVGSTALGLSWKVEPIIDAVTDNFSKSSEFSEEAKQLPVGVRVTAVKLLNVQPIFVKNSFSVADEEGIQFQNIGERVDIPYIFGKILQFAEPVPLDEKQKTAGVAEKTIAVRLQLEDEKGNTKTVNLPVLDSKDWFNTDRGLRLSMEMSVIKISNFGEALTLGTKKMIDSSFSIYNTLVALGNGSVSPRALGGPVAIVRLAYMFADGGLGSYLMFLCLIGANLAVINIFPMLPLDGGHAVFLLYEGIFRRPPHELILVILSYLGLFLILLLMFWTLFLDFTCIPRL
ncbi:MAG: site-2 protease family protein [Planctomycetaceae bacterium]|jgi:regulator of sigma E protease|nr:site-2 protease family protein [Planctomycetaceae bacterium]